MTNYLQHLAERFEGIIMKTLLWSLYTILPNFENFNIQSAVVLGTKVSLQHMGKVVSYGVLYTAAMLLLGYLLFAEREV